MGSLIFHKAAIKLTNKKPWEINWLVAADPNLRKVKVEYRQPIGSNEFKDQYEETIVINTHNTKVVSFDKYYGSRINTDNYAHGEYYAFANQFYARLNSYTFPLVSQNWVRLDDSKLTNLTAFIRDKYSVFYQKNKKRISFGIVNVDDSNQLQPFSKMMLTELAFQCYLLGYEWNIKTDTYSIEVLEQSVIIPETNVVYYGPNLVKRGSDRVIYSPAYDDGRGAILVPTITSAETSEDGTKIIIAFDTYMSDYFGDDILIAFIVGSASDSVVTNIVRSEDLTYLELSITPNIIDRDEVLLTYDPFICPVFSVYGMALERFDDYTVTNKSLAQS